jgi:colanic acid/amylovoran biosynthesis glycosyltransferase
MRVAIVGVRWPPETFIARRIKALMATGIEVSVLASGVGFSASADMESARVTRVPGSQRSRGKRLVSVLAGVVGLALARPGLVRSGLHRSDAGSRLRDRLFQMARFAAFLRLEADIFHFEWNSTATEFLPVLEEPSRPVVISCRGSDIYVRPHLPDAIHYRELLEASFARASAVHCVSQHILEEATSFGLDPTKAVVIHPAVDTAAFSPPQERLEGPALKVVSVGSLNWVKGYEYALAGIRRALDMGVSLRYQIVGEGVDFQRTIYTIRDMGLENHVELLGRLTEVEVCKVLQESHVFLLSSLAEGVSNASLEAMACGLPVVTTACGGMPEAVSDGIEGIVVPPRDPRAIAEALAKMASDLDLRERLGKHARHRAVRDFDLACQTEAFVSLYRKVLTELDQT